MKKVFVLGGTGFLGYHTICELLKRDYQVKTMSLPPMPSENLFPDNVESHLGDINQMSDSEIVDMLYDVDGFVYAIGADERWLPDAPSYRAFYQANVLPTQRIARLAVQAGVESFVVFGSYFSEFAERLPQYNLKNQGYPGTRLLQEQIAFAEGEGAMRVTSLRLPYIFGTMPGRTPLWKMFVDMVRDQPVYPVHKGGTAIITATQVAEAAVGALENGTHRTTYAICDSNLKYEEFFHMIVEALNQDTQIHVVDYESMADRYIAADQHAAAEGKEHGIHVAISQKMNEEDLYLDPADTMETLGITPENDIKSVIRETLRHCI
ncbi:NAD-dependent epimerase/dehydratase family protein [Erysipelothrix sp. P66]|uniref:NAD-dependent epimerase/dehydratase family protein n=1 Tax=Erysipelothrix sp. P66 TaxID=3141531 RepID=UPI00315DA2C2